MRHFVVIGHDAPTSDDFSLDDLAGGAGRLDVLCRSVGAALFLSHGVREDTQVHLVLSDSVTVRVDGSEVRYMHPDERNVAGLLRDALGEVDRLVGHVEVESSPGIHVAGRGVEPTLERVADRATVVHLHEDGDPVAEDAPPADPAFVLSDHREFTEREADLLADRADRRVRLGPERLHANHAIAVAHNYCDTAGYTTY